MRDERERQTERDGERRREAERESERERSTQFNKHNLAESKPPRHLSGEAK
jgi:hypothetical protein